jgi:hypothetical protein
MFESWGRCGLRVFTGLYSLFSFFFYPTRPQAGRGRSTLPQSTPRFRLRRPGTGAHFGGPQVFLVRALLCVLLPPLLPAACWRAVTAGGVGRWCDHADRGAAAFPAIQRLGAAAPALPPARSNSVAAGVEVCVCLPARTCCESIAARARAASHEPQSRTHTASCCSFFEQFTLASSAVQAGDRGK